VVNDGDELSAITSQRATCQRSALERGGYERRKWRSVARILAHARAVRHHSIDHRLIADGETIDDAQGWLVTRRRTWFRVKFSAAFDAVNRCTS